MGELFKPWQKRIGLLTLILACMFFGAWIRSVETSDDVCLGLIQIRSVHAGICCEIVRDAPHAWSFRFKSSRASGYLDVYQDREWRHVWKWRSLGLAIGRREAHGQSLDGRHAARKHYYYVRYHTLVFSLSLLSAFLLLSKPKRSSPLKIV